MTEFEERYEKHLEDRVKDQDKAVKVVRNALMYVMSVCNEVVDQIDHGRVVDRPLFDAADGLVICAQNAIADIDADEFGDSVRRDISKEKDK